MNAPLAKDWSEFEPPPLAETPLAPEATAAIGVASPPIDLSSCLVSGGELDRMIVPKRPRLLGYWLCQGDLGFIFAPRGVGKTWLAMALPTAISRSEPMGAWEAGEMKAKVLYVDGEMPLQLTQYRARGLRAAEGDVVFLHHDLLFEKLECSLNIASVEHQQAITALLLKENCNVVILDNLSSLASGVDENKGFHYEGIATWLLELRRRKITVVVIHHAGRNGMMRGHSKREDACSWILELKDAKAEGEPGAKFVSHFAKPSRNTGDSQADLLWHFTTDGTGRVNIQCEAAQATEFESMVGHIIEGVENQGDLAELMKVTKGTISKWCKRALNEGRIKRSGNKMLPANTDVSRTPKLEEVLD